MNKYVKQTIKNLKAAGFKVKAWVQDEYITFELADRYSDFSLHVFTNVEEIGFVYIVNENEGLEAISDYSIRLEPYIATA